MCGNKLKCANSEEYLTRIVSKRRGKAQTPGVIFMMVQVQEKLCLFFPGMFKAMKAALAESGGLKPTELHRDHLADPH